MKRYIKIISFVAFVLALSSMAGCQQDEQFKPHALLAESSLTFEAIGAEPQLLKIASDEGWVIETPEWISVDPLSGSKTVDVTVSVSDNGKKGAMNAPRQASIIITSERGYSIETVIFQKGDNYLGAPVCSVSELYDLEPETKVKVKECQVIAYSTEGFVVSDGDAMIHVNGTAEVKTGDYVTLAGETATINGQKAFKLDEFVIERTGDVVYPSEPSDLNSNVDSFESSVPVYVKITGTLVYPELLNLEGSPAKGVRVLAADPALGIDDVNIHIIDITGYFVGIKDNKINIIVTSVEDKGEDTTIGVAFPFRDDFSWLDKYVEMANANLPADKQISDCVADQLASSDGAANVYTTLKDSGLLEELHERGYTDLNPSWQTIYLQQGYLKYGKTDCESGLILPLMSIEGEQDIIVSFKYCAHISGAGNPDKVNLVVSVTGPGTVVGTSSNANSKVSDDIAHSQGKNQMFWQDASVRINGAQRSTRISIHPNPLGTPENVIKGVFRYYLDDIVVMPESAAVPARIVVEGVEEDLITFEGTPDAPFEFDVTSDMDYYITSSAKWLDFDVDEGKAGEIKTIKVTCQPNESSSLRKSSIIIKSGMSSRTISVVQSSAGSDIQPFVSVVGGNYVTVIGEGEEFAARVQANVDYEIEASEWISVVPAVDTRALVEVREHRFVAAPNMTGAKRTGFVRFRQGELEAVLNVTQDNFEPRIDMTLPRGLAFISASGASVPVHIEANVDFTVSSDLLSLPTGVTPAGEYDMDFTVPANAGLSRDVAVTFYNEKYDFTCEYRIVQHGTDVIFADDFSWLAPIVKALGEGNYDTVGSKDLGAKAPNIYTTAAIKDAFVPLCNEIGYFIPGKADGANDVLYLQDCYLKMGKTSSKSQTSLTLPSMDAGGQAFTLSFDWARMVQGDGTIDKYTLTLMITGNGTFANGTKYSDELSTPQGKGEIFWTNVSAEISGADKDTRITIVATDLLDKSTGNIDYTKSGGKRMFIDNIVAKIN